jgi:uracil-DNA glycosylase
MTRSKEAKAADFPVSSYGDALAAFRAKGGAWASLPFFVDGAARAVAEQLDMRARAGAHVLPGPAYLFRALEATPFQSVKVVILGQDPYPTPGDAHGLAFSVERSAKLPPSLANIFKELASDLGIARPAAGDLSGWTERGVLLVNTCLTVEAGRAGCHRGIGWQRLADDVIAAVSAAPRPAVFILWGNDARSRKTMIDAQKHLVIESAHPSPLSARGGFLGSRPFSRANAFLRERGRGEIDWRLA